jgi:hypothetical protein
MCHQPGAVLVPMINRFNVGWKEAMTTTSKQPNVLQPRDHQVSLSVYRDQGKKWGIEQIGREEGLVCPPARVIYRRINHPDLRNTLREGLVRLEKI